MTERICEDRVVAITGAGRGIGRAYALEFARHGAKVVVNDLGGARDGEGVSEAPAARVVEEIRALGGEAVVTIDDVAAPEGARRLIDTAIDRFGRLDVLVNNAGIVRDRMLVNMDYNDWDAVINVHLRGTFGPTRFAATYWRERFKATGEPVGARLINTTSSSGLFGNPGQVNYAAAKAGIAAFTVVASRELQRYGVTANAVYPTARTRMTEDILNNHVHVRPRSTTPDPFDPQNFAAAVVWLGSERSGDVTGRVLGLRGGRLTVAEGWSAGPTATTRTRWEPDELDVVLPDLIGRAAANAGVDGKR
ncbi:SDR family oxidoreductase [Nocardia sp. NPDC052278]|uniref:SDR family oxidoreductase n=1 Tax=unclassified Nocardia TaxID=2637762 RepID=UPI00368ECDB4